MAAQQTINQPMDLEGWGLFTGQRSVVRFRPAAPDAGITFVRTDQPRPVRVAASIDNVAKRARRTALRNGTVSIETVEHCLSACAGLGIDNLEIELTGDELPGMDGSCLPFVEKLQEAGPVEQSVPRRSHRIDEVVRVVDGDSELVALPPLDPQSEFLDVLYDLDYGPDNPIGRQVCTFRIEADCFVSQIAPARTFVLQKEAEVLLANGLGQHLTYDDILVFGGDGPIQNTLRFADECCRHKVQDLLGDLALLGRPLVGRVHARKSGHALNHALVRALAGQQARRAAAALTLEPAAVGIHRIQRILPHRYPFLMVDRILEIHGTQRVVGIKNVTINEEFFQGHYPGQPIMPGVLILEAMAQIGGILLAQELEHKGKVAVLLSMDKVKFRRAVMPGDQLLLTAEALRVKSRSGHVKTDAHVGTELVAEALIKFMMADADRT
ncbi:MAG: UDP-3-O-[3-hydroxymyristoyl] N-acetylglucosamine deacetylase [bacterium]|nr:UDP-3-O-[3-hydroxymyristoyl] N-acetylglucosamine deacetylase [bacterium]